MVLASCSRDDGNSSNNDNSPDSTTLIFPEKIVTVNYVGHLSTDYTYNGNKIVSAISDNGYKNIYTYTGDLITKLVEIQSDGTVSTTEYFYSNGKLSSKTRLTTGDVIKYQSNYTYNTDGTISYTEFAITLSTGDRYGPEYTGKLTFKDGNLIKDEKSQSGAYGTSSTYEYDTKNQSFKNVLGFNLLLNNALSVNNLVKRTYVTIDGTHIFTNEYEYDANGFPTEGKSFIDGAIDGTISITY